MSLSWREIKARAAVFAASWANARYERGESQTFYNDFFQIFGVSRRRVASFEEPVKRLGERQGFMDLFWKGVLLVEHKSAGGNLVRARQQALDYFPGLKDYELPRFVLVSDFETFELYDLDSADPALCFPLRRLADHIEAFGFILGKPSRAFVDQTPVNVEATALMGKLHDALQKSGYQGHDLERFLVRLVFCLFADDTNIFEPRGIFSELVNGRTAPDGSDAGPWLGQLFETLNTPAERRQHALDPDLTQFPYINGELFAERLPTAAFDFSTRAYLLEALQFNWDAISPAIFGSLFQSVMEPAERRAQGAHYTTGTNILKVIEPLFLDALKAEFQRLRGLRTQRAAGLLAFQRKLAGLRFFDPACGCGNFLVIAYRELRRLELEVLKALREDGQLATEVSQLSRLDVDQFYGIELGEFPARIAEVAMWMMDHQMNLELEREFGKLYPRIPLKKSPHIVAGDALEFDWNELLPASDCDYILGNPPFGGAKYQSPAQRGQVRRIARLPGAGGTLDYVAAWFIKAGEYLRAAHAAIGFVATNSITQGEQVAQLWPLLFDRCGLEITFAHRTFAWQSDARGMAHVHVVVIGLAKRATSPAPVRLFSYTDLRGTPIESTHAALTPYLFDASNLANRHLVVAEASRPLTGIPQLLIGSQPIDNGMFIFNAQQRDAFLEMEPRARRWMRPYVGAEEFINGGERWILYLRDASPVEMRAMPAVKARIAEVREFRKSSHRQATIKLAETPSEFLVTVVPDRPFLVIPEVSSERRMYVPIGWLKPPAIPSNLLRVLLNADLWHFGVLTSTMHMAWLRQIAGRLKSDYRYSVGMVYNPFPWPGATTAQRAKIAALAQSVLDCRAEFPQATLADLYDAEAMPPHLRKAHQALDAAVDKLYRPARFATERERVEHLFRLYELLVQPLAFPTDESLRPPRRRRQT